MGEAFNVPWTALQAEVARIAKAMMRHSTKSSIDETAPPVDGDDDISLWDCCWHRSKGDSVVTGNADGKGGARASALQHGLSHKYYGPPLGEHERPHVPNRSTLLPMYDRGLLSGTVFALLPVQRTALEEAVRSVPWEKPAYTVIEFTERQDRRLLLICRAPTISCRENAVLNTRRHIWEDTPTLLSQIGLGGHSVPPQAGK